MKKRHSYGTVMIDIETSKIVDMINSRNSEDVEKWLNKFPNISIVSRDGALTYSKAISASKPKALQISDRFHILKNLTDYCKSAINKILGIKKLYLKDDINNNIEDEKKQTNDYIIQTNSEKNKDKLIRQAKNLYKEGYTKSKIV